MSVSRRNQRAPAFAGPLTGAERIASRNGLRASCSGGNAYSFPTPLIGTLTVRPFVGPGNGFQAMEPRHSRGEVTSSGIREIRLSHSWTSSLWCPRARAKLNLALAYVRVESAL